LVEPSRPRARRVFSFAMKLGLDIGGTKIEAAVLDAAGNVRFRKRVATPAGYDPLLAVIADVVKEADAETSTRVTVGVGAPGGLSRRTGLMQNVQNIDSMMGRPFNRDLETKLKRPVRLANDADCFALSEASDGAGAGASIVLGIILGTGCGGGLVVERRLLPGANAAAGEWGHNSLPWPNVAEVPGPPCACGKPGCMELYLSGPGLQRDHFETTGEPLSARTIVARALSGDTACYATFERYIDRLARAMASLINLFDPDVIVVGGGLSRIAALYERVPARWSRYLTGSHVETRFVANLHGDASGVRGAARLWD
jgi:fructokinase